MVSTLEAELATLAAIATQVAEPEGSSPEVAGQPEVAQQQADVSGQLGVAAQLEAASTPAASEPDASQAAREPAASEAPTEHTASALPLPASVNSYALISIEGQREMRPAEEHGDLNLKLREPQLAQFEPTLVDIPNAGSDPNAPRLSAVLEANFVATYAVHDWDWACNCKGDLIGDESAVLVGIGTRPGEPIFIPSKEQDIFGGEFYATVLYASEDSLTFVYTRAGNVVRGYTVHYLGLQTDPNLGKLFRESQGNELPGLTLDTPVGLATDELIVAIRDNGTLPALLVQPPGAPTSGGPASSSAPISSAPNTLAPPPPVGTPTPGAAQSRVFVEDTEGYRQLGYQLSAAPASASFSPTGDQIAVTEGIKLYLVTADAFEGQILLAENGILRPIGGAVWSPDGKYIAVVLEKLNCSTCRSVGLVRLSDGSVSFLQTPPNLGSDTPRWTQDGRLLVNVHPGEPADGTTYIYDLSGRGEVAVGTYALSTSHDGQRWFPWRPGRTWRGGVSERPDTYYSD